MDSSIFIHESAIVEPGARIGVGTRVWAFAHILPGAAIGADCNICDHVFIENDVTLGDRVTVKCGVQLWDGITLEDDVFIGPNATFTNDLYPRSKHYQDNYPRTVVCKEASVGANATILPGITIGRNAMVSAGAVVTRNVPPNAIVIGSPARIEGYVSANSKNCLNPSQLSAQITTVGVPGVQIIRLPLIVDMRGKLSFAEYDKHLPFDPKRYFMVFDVPTREVRGEHAHKTLHQFLVCIKGSCSVVVENGREREELVLDRPDVGLHVPPMIWTIQYKYSSDAVLLVIASDVYDADDYIREYDKYLELMEQQQNDSTVSEFERVLFSN